MLFLFPAGRRAVKFQISREITLLFLSLSPDCCLWAWLIAFFRQLCSTYVSPPLFLSKLALSVTFSLLCPGCVLHSYIPLRSSHHPSHQRSNSTWSWRWDLVLHHTQVGEADRCYGGFATALRAAGVNKSCRSLGVCCKHFPRAEAALSSVETCSSSYMGKVLFRVTGR